MSGECMHDEVRPVSGQQTSPLFEAPIVNSDPECSLLFYFSISRFFVCGLWFVIDFGTLFCLMTFGATFDDCWVTVGFVGLEWVIVG